jgi:hypothetical protein
MLTSCPVRGLRPMPVLRGLDAKNAEAPQLDSFAAAQGFFHGVKHGLDGLFGAGAADAGLVHNSVYDIELDHGPSGSVSGSLC